MSYVKESVNTKVVGFLRVFWFPPQGMLTGWVGVSPLTDPSTVAVLRDQTRVIRWLPEAPLESFRLGQVELRLS